MVFSRVVRSTIEARVGGEPLPCGVAGAEVVDHPRDGAAVRQGVGVGGGEAARDVEVDAGDGAVVADDVGIEVVAAPRAVGLDGPDNLAAGDHGHTLSALSGSVTDAQVPDALTISSGTVNNNSFSALSDLTAESAIGASSVPR